MRVCVCVSLLFLSVSVRAEASIVSMLENGASPFQLIALSKFASHNLRAPFCRVIYSKATNHTRTTLAKIKWCDNEMWIEWTKRTKEKKGKTSEKDLLFFWKSCVFSLPPISLKLVVNKITKMVKQRLNVVLLMPPIAWLLPFLHLPSLPSRLLMILMLLLRLLLLLQRAFDQYRNVIKLKSMVSVETRWSNDATNFVAHVVESRVFTFLLQFFYSVFFIPLASLSLSSSARLTTQNWNIHSRKYSFLRLLPCLLISLRFIFRCASSLNTFNSLLTQFFFSIS